VLFIGCRVSISPSKTVVAGPVISTGRAVPPVPLDGEAPPRVCTSTWHPAGPGGCRPPPPRRRRCRRPASRRRRARRRAGGPARADDLQEADIDAPGKARVMPAPAARGVGHRCGVHIVHQQHGMRVAHGHHATRNRVDVRPPAAASGHFSQNRRPGAAGRWCRRAGQPGRTPEPACPP
jgi:hypothetical protein